MSSYKISELPVASEIDDGSILYVINQGISKQISFRNLLKLKSINRQILTQNIALTESSNAIHFMNPNGVDRTITLPPNPVTGWNYYIKNIGTNNLIIIESFEGSGISTLLSNDSTNVIFDGIEWQEA